MADEILPDIFQYTDWSTYMGDYFKAKNAKGRRFTQAACARSLDMSKSMLAMCLSGKRDFPLDKVERLCTVMGLDEAASDYMRLLIGMTTKDPEVRRSVMRSVAEKSTMRKFRYTDDFGDIRLHSAWYVGAIWEMADLPGFRGDPDYIVDRLYPPISREQAREALDLLLESGTLFEKGGRLVKRKDKYHSAIRMDPHWYESTVRMHNSVMDASRDALVNLPGNERYFVNALMSIPEGSYSGYVKDINTMLESLLLRYEQETEAPTRVYQWAIQLFPVAFGDNGEREAVLGSGRAQHARRVASAANAVVDDDDHD